MAKQKYFDAFLSNIEPSKSTVDYISSVQTNLRDYLATHDKYEDIHIDTFLSGSYAKHTCIRPVKYDGKRDVDIVVVTNHVSSDDSSDVLDELLNVLIEKDIYKNAEIQSHSVGVEMSGIQIDVVPVIGDDEEGLYNIGSYNDGDWILTDPKGHKKWSTETNQENDNQFKPLVKLFKWWRRENCPQDIRYPKGIALEKMIADNIADSSLITENLLIGTMQNLVTTYKEEYMDQGLVPIIDDPTIEDNNLLVGYTFGDFKAFIEKIEDHIALLDEEGTSNETWKKILGNEFPAEDSPQNSHAEALAELNIEKCLSVPHRQKPIWSLPIGNAVFIGAKIQKPDGSIIKCENDSEPIAKHCSIVYTAICSVKPPFDVKWQIVNTGDEAIKTYNCPRGGFENSNKGRMSRSESTAYIGKHYVQCFIIKGGRCVAKSKEFIINIE